MPTRGPRGANTRKPTTPDSDASRTARRPAYRIRPALAKRTPPSPPLQPPPPARPPTTAPTQTTERAKPKDPPTTHRRAPIVRWVAPVCPACGDPGRVTKSRKSLRYHVCTNPDCSIDRYRSIQLNFNPEIWERFRKRPKG